MMKKLFEILVILCTLLTACSDDKVPQQEKDDISVEELETGDPQSTLPRLRVEGCYLKDVEGKVVNLHGFAQTYSPYFNQNAWTNYNVWGCLAYNKRMIDEVLAAGWKVNFIRLHMDPYWSDDTSKPYVRYEGHERFSATRFSKYLDEVFVPMAEYAISKGLYVVMRPPGVCPEKIAVGDDYNEFLLTVWSIVARHPKLKDNPDIMFELANEPIKILGTDGTYASVGDGHFSNLKLYFQSITDKIRETASNIIWIPGLAYQSSYSGYAAHRIEGANIGYAIHVYPGWYGSDAEEASAELGGGMGGGYESFQRGWDAQIKPVANFAPVMVTEMDWAPKKYNSSWGKSFTGVAGGAGFGANFKYIADNTGNVSWLLFTDCHLMAQFKEVAGTPGAYTFLNDPEACPWPIYQWFKAYSDPKGTEGELTGIEVVGKGNEAEILTGSDRYLVVKASYADGSTRLVTVKAVYNSTNPAIIKVEPNGRLVALKDGDATVVVTYTAASGQSKQTSIHVRATTFPLTTEMFNPSIWEKGTFEEATRTLVTGTYGFGGWQYGNGIDLSGYKYLVVELGNDNECSASFRLFDKNNYWTKPAVYNFGTSRRVVVELDHMYNENQEKLNASHLYIIGFWSVGGKPIVIENIYLQQDTSLNVHK